MHIMKLFKSFSEQSFENYYQNLEWLGFLINLEIKYLSLELFNGVKFLGQTNMLHVHDSSWDNPIEQSAWLAEICHFLTIFSISDNGENHTETEADNSFKSDLNSDGKSHFWKWFVKTIA